MMHPHLSEPVKHLFDVFALGTVLTTLLGWLPAATAGLAFIWTAMRIYETAQNIMLNREKLRNK